MKECPFCGARDESLQVALIRIVCTDCGASGPTHSAHPADAWDDRVAAEAPSTSWDAVLDQIFIEGEWDTLFGTNTALRVDGTLESVREALAEIFGREE